MTTMDVSPVSTAASPTFCGTVNGDDRAAGLKEKLSKALSELVKLRRTENDLRAKLNAFGTATVTGTAGEDVGGLRRRVFELTEELQLAREELKKAPPSEYPKLVEANARLEQRLAEVEMRLDARVRELNEEQQLRRQFEENLMAEKQLRSTLNAYMRIELQSICSHVRTVELREDSSAVADVVGRLMDLTDKLDVEYTSEEIVARLTEVGEMTEQLRTLQEGLESYEKRVRELETYLGDKTKNEQTLVTQLNSLSDKYDSLTQRILTMSKITEQKEAELRAKEDELRSLQLSIKQSSEDHESFARRTKSLEQTVRELELKNEMLRAALDSAVLKADEKTQELTKKIESNKDWEVQEAVRKAVQDFADKIERLKTEHLTKLAEKDMRLNEQQAELNEQRQRLDTQRIELQSAMDKQHFYQTKLTDMTSELHQKIAELDQLRCTLPTSASSSQEIEELRSQIRLKEEAISDYKEALKAAQEDARKQIHEAKQSLQEELKNKETELQNKLEAKESELVTQLRLLEAKSTELETKSAEFTESLAQKNATIRENERSIKDKEESLAKLQEDLDSLASRAGSGGAQLAAQVHDLEQQQVSITIAKESLERQLVDCEDKITDLEETVCSLEDQLASNQEEIAKLSSQLEHSRRSSPREAELRNQLEEANSKLEKANSKLEQANGKLETVSHQLELREQQIAEAQKEKEVMEERTSGSEQVVSDDDDDDNDGSGKNVLLECLQKEKIVLTEAQASLELEVRSVRSEKEKLEEKVASLEDTITDLEEKLRNAKETEAGLKSKSEELESRAEESRAKLASNVSLINDLKTVIGELEKSKCELTTELGELRSQLEDQDPARSWQFDAGLIRFIEEAKKASSSMASINLTRKCPSGEMVKMLRKTAYYFATRAEGLREETNVLKAQLTESGQAVQKSREERAQDQEAFNLRLHNATMDMEKLDNIINTLREQLAVEKRARAEEAEALRRDNETLNEKLASRTVSEATATVVAAAAAEVTPKTRVCAECDSRKHQEATAPVGPPNMLDFVKAYVTVILGAITCIYVGYQLSYLTN